MAERFDQLTKALSATHSRRQALKLIGGGLLGAFGAVAGVGSAAAQGGMPCGLETCPPGWVCVGFNGTIGTCMPAQYCVDSCASSYPQGGTLYSRCVAMCVGQPNIG